MGNRYTMINHSTGLMTYSGWLIFDKTGSMRLNRSYPNLASGERAVQLKLKVPKSLFAEPEFSVEIDLNDNREPMEPDVIEAGMAQALHEAGFKVEVVMKDSEDGEQ